MVSPNGKNVAFIYRGDVYVTATDYSTTKQVTDTPEAESHLSWGNDSTLYFTSGTRRTLQHLPGHTRPPRF